MRILLMTSLFLAASIVHAAPMKKISCTDHGTINLEINVEAKANPLGSLTINGRVQRLDGIYVHANDTRYTAPGYELVTEKNKNTFADKMMNRNNIQVTCEVSYYEEAVRLCTFRTCSRGGAGSAYFPVSMPCPTCPRSCL